VCPWTQVLDPISPARTQSLHVSIKLAYTPSLSFLRPYLDEKLLKQAHVHSFLPSAAPSIQIYQKGIQLATTTLGRAMIYVPSLHLKYTLLPFGQSICASQFTHHRENQFQRRSPSLSTSVPQAGRPSSRSPSRPQSLPQSHHPQSSLLFSAPTLQI